MQISQQKPTISSPSPARKSGRTPGRDWRKNPQCWSERNPGKAHALGASITLAGAIAFAAFPGFFMWPMQKYSEFCQDMIHGPKIQHREEMLSLNENTKAKIKPPKPISADHASSSGSSAK